MDSSEILEMRTALGLTQKELAQRLGVDRSAVAQWEGGFTSPRGPAQILLRQIQEEARRLKKSKRPVDRKST